MLPESYFALFLGERFSDVGLLVFLLGAAAGFDLGLAAFLVTDPAELGPRLVGVFRLGAATVFFCAWPFALDLVASAVCLRATGLVFTAGLGGA